VFLLNSCLELDIAARWALFLPKLQSYFAEFLKESSLALLGILYLPTCVGLGYRQYFLNALQAFLGRVTSIALKEILYLYLNSNVFTHSHRLEYLNR
jgi:hypothetical protein